MANKALFATGSMGRLPKPDARNSEGSPAYALPAKHALAQYAATGCLNSTFYAGAREQLDVVLGLCRKVDTDFIARTAVFCRERGHMKDMPALLCAVLAKEDVALLERVFPRVIDNAKMLRNFVQMVRSGVAGRSSFGSAPRRMVRRWLEARSDEALFRSSVGQKPSLGDIVKMVHPKPSTPSRNALYGYLAGRIRTSETLPELVQAYEAFRAGESLDVPEVPMEMLTALPLSTAEWREIARRASWQVTRINLNTFARHGVFGEEGGSQNRAEKEITRLVADRLRDASAIRGARALPFQLLVAYANVDQGVPGRIREALQDALDVALANVPEFEGKVYVLLDVSGSMHSPATGHRPGATSVVRCLDVAALVAAALVRKNPWAEVLPFNEEVVDVAINPRDSVLTNATKLAALPQGGTNCSAPLRQLNRYRAEGDLVIFVSDNESWVDAAAVGHPTKVMAQWSAFKGRNPKARLACIDLQPNRTTQAQTRDDVLNVGGFSDQVFDVLAAFGSGRLTAGHWVAQIERIEV
jgi:60 kDa SS-A/Ro ribonucleoprotein